MPQIDPYAPSIPGLESPASNALTVVPSDTQDLPVKPRALIIGDTAGTLSVQMDNGTLTIYAHEGAILPIRPTRIFATGTTARTITAVW